MKIVEIYGGPGSGKSTLAIGLQYEASKQYLCSHYISEFIKDYANRKIPISPINQLWIAGNQSHLETAIYEAGCDFAFTDSSPFLCACFANFYTGNQLPMQTSAVLEWEKYVESINKVRRIKIFLDIDANAYAKQYSAGGRYEDFKTALELHHYIHQSLKQHTKTDLYTTDERNPTEILEFIKNV